MNIFKCLYIYTSFKKEILKPPIQCKKKMSFTFRMDTGQHLTGLYTSLCISDQPVIQMMKGSQECSS